MWRNVQGWQLVILLVVIIVVFGAARLPNAARSLGKSLKIFKSEVKDLRSDDETEGSDVEGTDSKEPDSQTSTPSNNDTASKPVTDPETSGSEDDHPRA